MAPRAGRRRSVGFYCSLDALSTADVINNNIRRTWKGNFFEVERVISCRKKEGKREYLIRWKGYSSLPDSWEQEEDLNEAALRAYTNPKPTSDKVQEGSDALAFAILQHLKGRHQTASASTVAELRHDILQFLFKGKGSPSTKAGCTLLYREDFNRCKFFNTGWDTYIDNLGDGTRVVFPVRMEQFLSWGPKTHQVMNGKIIQLPRYHVEKVSITFNKRPFTTS